jgi:hypothetical protein
MDNLEKELFNAKIGITLEPGKLKKIVLAIIN